MENKPAQNIQDSFLNTARKDKATITLYLLSGVKLTGRIRSFDKYSVVLETNNQEQLIFKHAISTVVMAKPHGPERVAPAERVQQAAESRSVDSKHPEARPAANAGTATAPSTSPTTTEG
ncbi:MAG TPA: RNA chaperone Hfq [Terriglobales bacterium]|nr:RNA chaperone Hfq [Terriglobales bacterium]